MAWGPGGFPHNWDPFFRGDVSWMGCPAGDQAGFQDIPRHIGDYSDGPELPGMALEDAMSYMPPMGWLIMVWENQCFAFLWTTLRFSKTMIHPMITWKIYEHIRYLEFWYLEFWYLEFSMIQWFGITNGHQRSPRQLLMMIQSHAASGHTIFAALQVLGAPRTANRCGNEEEQVSSKSSSAGADFSWYLINLFMIDIKNDIDR